MLSLCVMFVKLQLEQLEQLGVGNGVRIGESSRPACSKFARLSSTDLRPALTSWRRPYNGGTDSTGFLP